MIEKNKKNDELKVINNTYNQEMQKLEKELERNEKYFNDHEKNRTKSKKRLKN